MFDCNPTSAALLPGALTASPWISIVFPMMSWFFPNERWMPMFWVVSPAVATSRAIRM